MKVLFTSTRVTARSCGGGATTPSRAPKRQPRENGTEGHNTIEGGEGTRTVCVCVSTECVGGTKKGKIFGETDVKRERARAGEGNVVECVEEGAGGRKQCVWS